MTIWENVLFCFCVGAIFQPIRGVWNLNVFLAYFSSDDFFSARNFRNHFSAIIFRYIFRNFSMIYRYFFGIFFWQKKFTRDRRSFSNFFEMILIMNVHENSVLENKIQCGKWRLQQRKREEMRPRKAFLVMIFNSKFWRRFF